MAPPADYYALLGVERDADSATIKRAFRALAREVHPDVSDAPGAEDRFSELAHAYRILSAPNARLLYDRFGFRGPGNGGVTVEGRVISEVRIRRPQAREGVRQAVRVAALDVCPACAGEVALCPACRGSGFLKRASSTSYGRLLQFDDCPECSGSGRLLVAACSQCGGEGRVASDRIVEVVVPPGARDGDSVPVAGGESVRVRVRPIVDEATIVRSAAAAALVIAVAFLVYLALSS